MERAVGPIFALLMLVIIGLGIYAYDLHSAVTVAWAQTAVAEQKAATAQTAMRDMGNRLSGISEQKAALDTCQTQLQEATQRADAAAQTHNGGGRHR